MCQSMVVISDCTETTVNNNAPKSVPNTKISSILNHGFGLNMLNQCLHLNAEISATLKYCNISAEGRILKSVHRLNILASVLIPSTHGDTVLCFQKTKFALNLNSDSQFSCYRRQDANI